MRVLIVSHRLADPALRGKARALLAQGCAVALAVPDRWRGADDVRREGTQFTEDAGLRVVPIKVRGDERDGPRLGWSGRQLNRLLADFRPEVVQVEEDLFSPVAARCGALARRLGIPVVYAVQESVQAPHSWLERRRAAQCGTHAAGLLAINRQALARAGARPGLPTLVLPLDGLRPPLGIRRPRNDALVLGFVGRLIPERGLDLLFRACALLRSDWRVTVVGSGPAQADLELLAERLGIASRVAWLGGLPRERLAEVYPTFDVLVLPARETPTWLDASGSVALDGMAHGVAVIASRTGALVDTVSDAGLLVPADDVEALAAAIGELEEDRRRCDALGQAGRARVMADFTEDAVARRTRQFWETVLGATARRAGALTSPAGLP